MGKRYSSVHVFKTSILYIEYKGAKNPPVINIYNMDMEDTGGS